MARTPTRGLADTGDAGPCTGHHHVASDVASSSAAAAIASRRQPWPAIAPAIRSAAHRGPSASVGEMTTIDEYRKAVHFIVMQNINKSYIYL